MKIIEAMNELKLTEKKLSSKLEFIKKFAARPSFRDDAFNGEEKTKVAQAVQSSMDLIAQHEKLKRSIDLTNLEATTEVNGNVYTLHSLLQNKRLLCKFKKAVYAHLDSREAEGEVATLRAKQAEGAVNAQVVYNYDIEDKAKNIMEVEELASNIDSALQIANAQLDIVETP